MEVSKYCEICFNKYRCGKQTHDMLDIKPSCYSYCEYQNINHGVEVNCQQCNEKHRVKYSFCCLNECGEHEFCRGCNFGIYKNIK